MKTKTLQKDKVNVITLGCSKNLVDSENIITQLQANEIDAEHENYEDKANIVVINTCGFIERAKEESINTILNYAESKKQGDIEKLYVTGCLSQRYKEDLEVEIPEVDAYFGTMELPGLLAKFNADYRHELIGERMSTTLNHFAYLKISEGCNRTCTFCAIPLMRGKHVSKSIENIIKEARHLVKNGVKEIILIAQELTYYGLDIYKERKLAELLDSLAQVDGIEWIRLHYAYPSKFPTDIFPIIAKHNNICNYLDIPLQHADDNVLKSMKRQITQQETKDLIAQIKKEIPNVTLRTTMLVGFPGESNADFESLCDFVREMRFDRLGVFMYSHEEGTAAYEMKDDVPDEIKQERANTLMEIQKDISLEINQQKIGQKLKVLIDRKEGEYYYGRTEGDSPEVDNEVVISAKDNYLRVGDFAEINITEATEYDLHGVVGG